MNELIIGGSKGLGLDMARIDSEHKNVIITGRDNPGVDFAEYREFDLTQEPLAERVGDFVAELPHIDSLVYSAGFFQKGHIDKLTDGQVDDMLNVCQRGLILFVKKILEKQDELGELVTITSTSQWTPRELEPVYNAAKAGAAHFSNGISKDPRVGKVIVAGPSGMASPFWKDTDNDTSKMMPTDVVAEQIDALRRGEYRTLPLHDPKNETVTLGAEERAKLVTDFSYCFAKVLGSNGELPQRVVIDEVRG